MTEKDIHSDFESLWLDDERPPKPTLVPAAPPPPKVVEKVVEKVVVVKEAPTPKPKKPRKPKVKKVEEPKPEPPPVVVEAPKPTPPPTPNPIPVSERFADLRSMVELVAKGVRPALFLSGQAGASKTYTVTYVLEQILGLKEGEDFFLCKGETTPKGIYSTLLKWNGKLVLFDDCDSAFANVTATNLLKGALDSMPVRRIVWISHTAFDPSRCANEEEYKSLIDSGKYPGYFDYTGRVIFISNIKFENVHPAIKSRSLVQNMELTRDEFIQQMRESLPTIRPDLDLDLKEKILDTLVKEYTNTNKEFSFRTLVTAIELKANNVADWLKIVSRYG